jgi:hypothetical protein
MIKAKLSFTYLSHLFMELVGIVSQLLCFANKGVAVWTPWKI